MPDSAVGDVVEKLTERQESRHSHQSRLEAIEIIEATVLALVAIATAWSGYQAARWDDHRAEMYSEASLFRTDAERLATLAGQDRIYDSQTFNSWLGAKMDGKENLAHFYQRRFRDEFRLAFTAWLKTEPFKNAQAPPGPIFMPEYSSKKAKQSLVLANKAAAAFLEGTTAGNVSNQYVRITVMLATVLLVTAVGQRFQVKAVRTIFMVVAALLLCFPLAKLLTLPRI